MPSPRFGTAGALVDAVSCAVREGWAMPDPDLRPRVVQAALRRILGDAPAGQVLDLALRMLVLQPQPPAGDVEPPTIAHLELCPRCREIRLKEERRPYRGRVKMEPLRDGAWMHRQFEQLRRSEGDVARDLGCCVQSVAHWRRHWEIDPPKSNRPWMSEAILRRLILTDRKAPGEIAQELGCEPWTVRDNARAFGIIAPGNKPGAGVRWAHFEGGWWAERVAEGLTQYAMAAAAGIATHAALYHLRKWGLHIERTPYEAARLRKPKFAKLYEPGWLRARLTGHGAQTKIAKQLGCSQTAVARAAEKLGLLAPGRIVPSPWTRDPAWYRKRFACKMTAAQMAAEVGIKEKSAYNYMAQLGLLEEYHQRVERWSDKKLQATRKATVARLLGRGITAAA